MSISIPVGDNPLRASTLLQYRDDIEIILDDNLVVCTTSIT